VLEYTACPELFNATTARLVEPSRKVTDPEVTSAPVEVTVAVSFTEVPT
jgi:hypothetical protein